MFTLPSIALFIHIVGAITLYTAIGIEWVFIMNIKKASHISTVKQWFGIMSKMGKLHGPSWLAILSSGIYLSAAVWGFHAWISVTLITIGIIMFFGAFVSGRILRNIGQSVAAADALTGEIRERLNNPVFVLSASIRTALAAQIILLMTIKPDLTGSLATLVLAFITGYSAYAMKNRQTVPANQIKQEITE
ncbi:MAG: hypothetical protein R6W90_18830 [Ignavibacteriaceae bacterium]